MVEIRAQVLMNRRSLQRLTQTLLINPLPLKNPCLLPFLSSLQTACMLGPMFEGIKVCSVVHQCPQLQELLIAEVQPSDGHMVSHP